MKTLFHAVVMEESLHLNTFSTLVSLKFVQIRYNKNKCVFKFLISSRNIFLRNFNACYTEVVLTKIVYITFYNIVWLGDCLQML